MSNSSAFPLTLGTFLLAFALAMNSQDKGTGSIGGIVVDEKGLPTPGVMVNASPMDGRMRHTLIRYVETDSSGRFFIDRLAWGRYTVSAMKESGGYPNTALAFYGNDVLQIATIAPSAPAAEVRIQLRPKAGIAMGSITNAATGAPLNVTFKLTRADAPNKWLSTSAPPNYRILLPSLTDVILEASAPGFKTWTPPSPLRLQPGTELQLDIALEPSPDPALHPSKFLVPDGYLGWLLLDYDVEDAEPVLIEAGVEVFEFSATGALSTSSPGPQRGAENEYYYYSPDGSLRAIPADYRNGKGMIWGEYEGTRKGALAQFGFFVGSEDQFKKYRSRATHPGPLPKPK